MSHIKNLGLEFENFQLCIDHWELPDKGVTALMGASGSGKSTLLRCLLGLEKPNPGFEWIFQGTNLASLPPEKRQLGVVFQNLALFPHLTAEQNILFAAKARGLSKTQAREKLESLSKSFSLSPGILKTPAAKLSGGQSQCTALARALIGQPQFLFLDEPFSSLDEELKAQVRKLTQQAISESNIPTLLITHDPRDCQGLGVEKITQIQQGRLV